MNPAILVPENGSEDPPHVATAAGEFSQGVLANASGASGASTPLPHPVIRLRQAWVEFLGQWEWHWFGTFTFDPARSSSPNRLINPEKASKTFRFFTNQLNCELFGKRWNQHGDGVYSVLALEPHKSGILHMHALIGAVVDLNVAASRVAQKEFWHDHFNIARIEEPSSGNDVRGYCTKYVSKGGELILSPTLRLRAMQRSLDLCRGQTK